MCNLKKGGLTVTKGYGTVNPGPVATGCGVPPTPAGGFFGINSWWLWIILIIIFILPSCGLGGLGRLGGLFGGFSWIWILILLIFLFPKILPGFGFGGFAL
jgi:hypothetical protein